MKSRIQKTEATIAGYADYEEMEESLFLATGTVIFSKYEIIRLVGHGGMGQVYLAKDLQLGRLVAVKTLSVENNYSAEHKNRFVREAQMAATINHPNVLTVYEAGFEGNRPFLVMEYIEGQTLREIISSSQMDMSLALNLAIQLAQGLLAMHKMGIIHRDLKLDNFILRKDGYLKILDFGLAKSTSEKENPNKFETKVGLVLGTPRYMSPEQARGQELTVKSDIFSFGSVLYELLANRLAFDDEDDMQAVYQVVFYQPQPLPESVPAKLRQIIEKVMEKKASARPETMQEVLDVLLAVRDELSLATEKKEVSSLFASTFISPVAKALVSKAENSVQKKFNVDTSTQVNTGVAGEVTKIVPESIAKTNSDSWVETTSSNLIKLPISHIVGSNSFGFVRPNNIFLSKVFRDRNKLSTGYEITKAIEKNCWENFKHPPKINKITKFPTISKG